MRDLITPDNLPLILGIVFSAEMIRAAAGFGRGFLRWRKGAKEYEKDIMRRTQEQLAECDQELARCEDERDEYRRKVGRRDYLLLKKGIQLPDDDREGEHHDRGTSGRTTEG